MNILSGSNGVGRIDDREFARMFVTVMENWMKDGAFENPAALKEAIRLAKVERDGLEKAESAHN